VASDVYRISHSTTQPHLVYAGISGERGRQMQGGAAAAACLDHPSTLSDAEQTFLPLRRQRAFDLPLRSLHTQHKGMDSLKGEGPISLHESAPTQEAVMANHKTTSRMRKIPEGDYSIVQYLYKAQKRCEVDAEHSHSTCM
jgi:hypothetical protein